MKSDGLKGRINAAVQPTYQTADTGRRKKPASVRGRELLRNLLRATRTLRW